MSKPYGTKRKKNLKKILVESLARNKAKKHILKFIKRR